MQLTRLGRTRQTKMNGFFQLPSKYSNSQIFQSDTDEALTQVTVIVSGLLSTIFILVESVQS
jgi:hypothetical protein